MSGVDDELARVAYQAYGDSVEWKNYQGLPMPKYDDLGEKIQKAWIAASKAAAHSFWAMTGH